jgi:hypothetical protein
MAEMAEVCRCDGVMDRIASILRFSTGAALAPSRQTEPKRIPNAFLTAETAGNCGNNAYDASAHISSSTCKIVAGVLREKWRKSANIAVLRVERGVRFAGAGGTALAYVEAPEERAAAFAEASAFAKAPADKSAARRCPRSQGRKKCRLEAGAPRKKERAGRPRSQHHATHAAPSPRALRALES